jgi:hypothetical protein
MPGKQLELSLDRPDVAEAKDKVRQMAEEHRAKMAAERAYTKPGMNTRVGGIGGEGAAADIKMLLNPKAMKKGGTASSRADGCCVKGKTKGRMA